VKISGRQEPVCAVGVSGDGKLVTTVPSERFHELLQDTLRGPDLAKLPFYPEFIPKRVAALSDRLPTMPDSDRVAWDPVLMTTLSACVLQQRFGL